MRQIGLIINLTLILVINSLTVRSQCAQNNTLIGTVTPPCPGTSTTSCINGGQYINVNVVAGNDYTFSTCGNTAFDTQITVYNGATVIGYNDDDCGTQSTVTWTATFTGVVSVLVDEYNCSNTGLCTDLDVTCSLPIQIGNGCNTNTTICTAGVAGPFGFSTPGTPVSSCLDFIGLSYAYVVLYVTQSGPLQMLIDGDASTGFLDVAIFDVPTNTDPCTAIQDVNNEISCNYALASGGCNEIGTFFGCGSNVPSPMVTAGDVLMIVVENWSNASTTFTLDLGPTPAAQTGPPPATINPAGPFCNTDAPFQLTSVTSGGTWSGTGVSSTGVFNPATAGVGTFTITHNVGSAPCTSSATSTVTVNNCSTCLINNFTANIGACQQNNTFPVSGTILYSNAPATGTLVVEVTNASGTYTQTFNPPFVNGTTFNFNITNAISDGSAATVEVYFTADLACTQIINFTSPAACGCAAEIGTFTADIIGVSTNNYVLCYGDVIDIQTNNDWTDPAIANSPPGPVYDPGVSWLIYSCPPTIGLVPTALQDVSDDPCLLGIVSDFDLNDMNDQAMINAFPAGTFTNNTIYYVPITMYSIATGTYSYVNTSVPCYDLGAPYAVQYLPQILSPFTQSCTAVTATISGGLPAVNGSQFSVVAGSLTPANASFGNTTCSNGGTIVINGLTTGQAFSFQVQDANGCPKTVSGTFVGPPTLTYPQAAYCKNASNPSPTITGPTGGTYSSTAGLSINASTGVINIAASTVGTYTVTYTSPAVPGPSCTATFVITINPLPVIAVPNQTVCAGTAVTLNGNGADTYTWTGGITNGVAFTPAATTTYTVTGTITATGCTSTDVATITVNPLPTVNAGVDQTVCAGTAVTLSGSGAATYTWNNGVTNGVAFTPAATTTYTVTGTSATGCINTDQVLVTVNPIPVVNAGPDVSICTGGSTTLTATGATAYSWAPGGQTTAAITVTPAATTTYTVTGTSLGCTSTDAVTVTILANAPINAGPDVAICLGASTTLTATGGVTYTWNNGLGVGNNFSVSPAVTTTYTVVGTNASGCTGTDAITVTVNPLPTVNAGTDQTICIGATVTLSGSGAATYTWNNGVTNGVAFTPAATTTYTVTGTDANGCINTDQVIVTVNPLPTVNAGTDQTVCAGTAVTLNGSGAATYTWNNGVTNGVAFTPAATTTYTVTGTSAAGCINTDQVVVTVNPLPTVNAGADQTVCIGASVTIAGSGAATYTWDNGITNGVSFTPTATATYTVTGTSAAGCINTDQVVVTVNPLPTVNAGTDQTICIGATVTLSGSGAATYTWNNGVTNGVAFTPAATTTYTVSGTDANGCINTDQVIVTVNPLPTVNAGIDPTVCAGTAVTLNGSGAATYTWNNGVTNGVAFTPAATTTYTVTGTSAAGCINTDQVVVTVNPLPTVNAGTDQTVCLGASVTLAGSGAATYTWDNGITNGMAFTPSLGTTTYTVTGTSAAGCINTDQVIVTVNPLPTPVINGPATYCAGNTALLSTSTPFTTYNWSTGSTNPTINATSADNPITVTVTNAFGCQATSPVFTVTQNNVITANFNVTICQGQSATIHGVSQTVAGVYSQTFTLGTGCDSTSNVTLIVNPLPAVNAGVDQAVCTGTATTLTATGATTYSWDNGITNGIPFTQAIGATTYTVTGTSAAGCVNTDQVTVTVNPLPTIGAGPDQAICIGAPSTLNGSGAVTYTWNNGVTNAVAFTPVATNTYTVTGTDANGCINTDQVVVTVNPLPLVNAGTDQTICIGGSATLTASGAATYSWDNGVTNGVSISPTATTTYTATGTSASGCVNTDQVVVTVNPLPIVNAGADQTICIGASATLSGSGAATYSWNNGVTDGAAFTPAATTTYTITGTSATGCVNTDQVTVTVNPLPTVGAGPDQTVCAGTAVTLNGSGAATYTWNNAVTNAVAFTPVATNTYTVTGTDANGCVNTDQVLVTVNPIPTVGAGADQTICIGATVTLSGSGAATYTWDNGVTNAISFAPTATTTYTVTGTSVAGCTSTDQVVVTVNPLPTVNAGVDQTICIGASVTLSGSGAATYSWNNGVTDGAAFTPAATTTYTVTGTSAAGCVNTDQVTVTVNPLPIVNAGPDQIVCAGTAVTLTASGAATYSWNNGVTDGTPFTPAATTTYTVTGTSAAGCINTDQVTVTVNPIPNVFAGNDISICDGQTATLSGSGAATYTWDNGATNGVAFTPAVGTTTYTVTGTSGAGCINTDQVIVVVNPNPVVAFTPDVTQGCAPLTVNFTNTTPNVSNCVWTMSDGSIINGCGTVTNTFTTPGCYDVTLTTTSNSGCVNSATIPNLICVEGAPLASFIPSNSILTEFDPVVNFNNTTIGASNYLWNFGDNSTTSTLEDPSHNYSGNDVGNYLITLIAYSPLGCTDTAYATIQIQEELIFYVPNTFTPDDDNYNQTFQPVFTSGFDPFDYTLLIFNRWGEIVFESHDANVGWDGSYGSNGEIEMVQDGTYTWKIEFKTNKNDERKMVVGHVNILK